MEGMAEGNGAAQEEGGGRGAMASNGASLCPVDFPEKLQYEAVVVCSVVRGRSHACADGAADEASSHADAVSFLVEAFEAAGLKVEVLEGMGHKVFIKVNNAR